MRRCGPRKRKKNRALPLDLREIPEEAVPLPESSGIFRNKKAAPCVRYWICKGAGTGIAPGEAEGRPQKEPPRKKEERSCAAGIRNGKGAIYEKQRNHGNGYLRFCGLSVYT